jgi:hypothetical protein
MAEDKTSEAERYDALQAIGMLLNKDPFCKGAIIISFYSGRRHVVSAESSRFPELNGLAGFPATDIHERMLGEGGIKDRLGVLTEEIARSIADNVDGISKTAVRSIGKTVADCLIRAATISIPEALN